MESLGALGGNSLVIKLRSAILEIIKRGLHGVHNGKTDGGDVDVSGVVVLEGNQQFVFFSEEDNWGGGGGDKKREKGGGGGGGRGRREKKGRKGEGRGGRREKKGREEGRKEGEREKRKEKSTIALNGIREKEIGRHLGSRLIVKVSLILFLSFTILFFIFFSFNIKSLIIFKGSLDLGL